MQTEHNRFKRITKKMLYIALLAVVIGVQGKEFEAEIKNVSGMAGDTLTLQTGLTELAEKNHVLWYLPNKETLIYLSEGEIMHGPPKRFEGRLRLDKETGSLTIQPLCINDTGIYQGEMFDKNNTKICYEFHLTAWKPAVPGHNTAADQRNNPLAVAPALAVFIVLFV